MDHHIEQNVRRSLRCALIALTAVALAGCANEPSVLAGPQGHVAVALVIPGGSTISSVSWSIKSSVGQSLASGTTNTSRAGASVSLAVGLPAGQGDTVTMTATTNAGIPCSGTSNPFDVTPNQTSSVSVVLNCGPIVADGGLGSVVITGTLVSGDNCPTLTAWAISPETAAANGGQIDVSATAADADTGDVLTYAWSAVAGSFAAPAATSTTYTCGAAGAQTLHLSVSDNHAPVPCQIDVAFPPVTCQ